MARYLEGINDTLVHKLWRLKQQAKKNGRRSTSILSILNAVLSDALADDRMPDLEARFAAPLGEVHGTQTPVPEPRRDLGAAGR